MLVNYEWFYMEISIEILMDNGNKIMNLFQENENGEAESFDKYHFSN